MATVQFQEPVTQEEIKENFGELVLSKLLELTKAVKEVVGEIKIVQDTKIIFEKAIAKIDGLELVDDGYGGIEIYYQEHKIRFSIFNVATDSQRVGLSKRLLDSQANLNTNIDFFGSKCFGNDTFSKKEIKTPEIYSSSKVKTVTVFDKVFAYEKTDGDKGGTDAANVLMICVEYLQQPEELDKILFTEDLPQKTKIAKLEEVGGDGFTGKVNCYKENRKLLPLI